MSIFRRESEPPAEPQPAVRPTRPAPRPPAPEKGTVSVSTHIAKGSKVVGQISGTADLVIDGFVDGEIVLESQVVVGPEGRVEGKILARSVEVGGHVLGNVQGLERVEVLATGSLEGDVLSPRVVIAEGAFFKGKVEMTDQKPQRSSAPDPKKAEPAKSEPKPAVDPKSGGDGSAASGGSPAAAAAGSGNPGGGGSGGQQGAKQGAQQGGHKRRHGGRR